MTKKNLRLIRAVTFAAILGVTLSACDSNEPDGDGAGEEEVITLVTLTLTPQGGGAAMDVDAVFDEAGVLQSVETIMLTAGTTYDVSVDLLNTLETPAESITEEIRDEEPHAHQFFYTAEGAVSDNIAITNLDTDPNGDQLGLTFDIAVTGGAGESGQFRLKLRHYEDDADLPEDKRNDTASASEVPGIVENDVNFTFPVSIS